MPPSKNKLFTITLELIIKRNKTDKKKVFIAGNMDQKLPGANDADILDKLRPAISF